MLSSAAAAIGGLFVGSQAIGAGADHASRVGLWSGALVIELLAVVPFLCAVPSLFHELAHSTLLHAQASSAVDISLGASELLPAMAILPFMLYQLSGFGTMHYIMPKVANWIINFALLGLILSSYAANRQGDYSMERHLVGLLVLVMAATVAYGVIKLKRMQVEYDANSPVKEAK
jgi:hypothetical protein